MKSTKKKIYSVLLSVLLLVVCTGCGSQKGKTVDISQLADNLKNGISYADELSATQDEMFFNLFAIDKGQVVTQKTYNNSGASAEIVSVVECKDNAGALLMKKAFEAFVSERSAMYKSYNPTEAAKLDSAVVMVTGEKYVVLCVSPNSAKAKEIINK